MFMFFVILTSLYISFSAGNILTLLCINSFGYSEFNHPFLIEEAERRGLFINYLGERQNLKNRRVEILITNYQARLTLF